ncbi:glycosyltransferase family 4 protein [Halospina sp. K52047b]|uniref:glycosyltransferase family 4 protein n=1 Tax=Halospina sp. K52047b TaxID=2614160 RepID=UPI00124ADDAA|nr:glycosyltransferase family 4 protein [Halospina sp. K52047b]KAA8976813.1 glycosyltransferase family 4 protein [Halospina sp. K52047b]
MRIIYLHQYFNTPQMSGGTRSYEMARRLVASGHEVHMITSWRETGELTGGDWFETEEAGIRVHWLPVPYNNAMSFRERLQAFFRFALKSARKAAGLPADVVFATSTPLTIAIPGAYTKWRQGIPMVFEIRDLWPELPIAMGALKNPISKAMAHRLESFAYRSSKRIVALSPGMRDGVLRSGYPQANISVIPNSSDLDFFDPSSAAPEDFLSQHPELRGYPLVVYTGTLGAINGVDYVPRIAAAAREQGLNIQFAVIGRGIDESRIREEAERLGVLGYNFHLYPPISKAETPNVLAAADIALSLFINLKPMWANSANKFFDALASGTPVAINYSGWQADTLNESGAGIQLPPEEPHEAARQLGELLAHPDRLKEMGEAARRLAEEKFSRDKLADELESVLLDAVSSPDDSQTGTTPQ